jgi:hypothetical protein
MINAAAIERALIGVLAGDAELATLLPDGVFWDLAEQGSTRFAIVSLSVSRAQAEFHDLDSFRTLVYGVKAVIQSTSTVAVADADARIQALLDRQPIPLPPETGAGLMLIRWLDRIRYTETVDTGVWQHGGARYEVTVTPV